MDPYEQIQSKPTASMKRRLRLRRLLFARGYRAACEWKECQDMQSLTPRTCPTDDSNDTFAVDPTGLIKTLREMMQTTTDSTTLPLSQNFTSMETMGQGKLGTHLADASHPFHSHSHLIIEAEAITVAEADKQEEAEADKQEVEAAATETQKPSLLVLPTSVVAKVLVFLPLEVAHGEVTTTCSVYTYKQVGRKIASLNTDGESLIDAVHTEAVQTFFSTLAQDVRTHAGVIGPSLMEYVKSSFDEKGFTENFWEDEGYQLQWNLVQYTRMAEVLLQSLRRGMIVDMIGLMKQRAPSIEEQDNLADLVNLWIEKAYNYHNDSVWFRRYFVFSVLWKCNCDLNPSDLYGG